MNNYFIFLLNFDKHIHYSMENSMENIKENIKENRDIILKQIKDIHKNSFFMKAGLPKLIAVSKKTTRV